MHYSYYSSSGLPVGIGIALISIMIAIVVLFIMGYWKMIAKTGKPGWSCIVPFYGSYCEYAAFWGNGWLFLVPLILEFLFGIPVIGILLVIISVIINILHRYKMALAFGKGIGFTIGLIFLPPIFTCILGFGDSKYLGVPQDGTSYKQLRKKIGKAEEEIKEMKFEEAPKEPEIHVDYEKPEEGAKTVACEKPNTSEVAKPEAEPIVVNPEVIDVKPLDAPKNKED